MNANAVNQSTGAEPRTFESFSVESAIAKGLSAMNLQRDYANIEIVDRGRQGFLGMFSKPAVVSITPKPFVHTITLGDGERFASNRTVQTDIVSSIGHLISCPIESIKVVEAEVARSVSDKYFMIVHEDGTRNILLIATVHRPNPSPIAMKNADGFFTKDELYARIEGKALRLKGDK